MPTSLAPTLSLDREITRADLWFYRDLLQSFVHECVTTRFRQLADAGLMTQAKLAERIHRDAASVNRSLANPRNLTLNTISDLMVGMGVDPTTLLVDEQQAPASDTVTFTAITETEDADVNQFPPGISAREHTFLSLAPDVNLIESPTRLISVGTQEGLAISGAQERPPNVIDFVRARMRREPKRLEGPTQPTSDDISGAVAWK